MIFWIACTAEFPCLNGGTCEGNIGHCKGGFGGARCQTGMAKGFHILST